MVIGTRTTSAEVVFDHLSVYAEQGGEGVEIHAIITQDIVVLRRNFKKVAYRTDEFIKLVDELIAKADPQRQRDVLGEYQKELSKRLGF